jgi:hypothetical protein
LSPATISLAALTDGTVYHARPIARRRRQSRDPADLTFTTLDGIAQRRGHRAR